MKRKFILRVMAWLLTIAMLLPSAGAALTTAYAASYAGDYAEGYSISVTELAAFEGDVTMTVEYTEVAGYDQHQFSVFYKGADWSWNPLTAADFAKIDNAPNAWNFIELASGKSSITMTLSEKIVKKAIENGKGMGIQVFGVIIDKVTLGGEKAELDDSAYAGDWNLGYTVNANTFEKVTGDVKVTVEYQQVSKGYDYFQMIVMNKVDGWPKLVQSDYAELNNELNDYGCLILTPGESSVTFVLKESTAKVLASGGGLGFQVYGIIITDVTVEAGAPATPTPTPTPTATPTPTPIPVYTTVGDTLTVTADMVVDGVVTVKDSKYNEIIIPEGLELTKVVFYNVAAEDIKVTGGDYSFEIARGEIGNISVAAPTVQEISFEDLKKALEACEDALQLTEVIKTFHAFIAKKQAIENAEVKFTATEGTLVNTINVNSKADLNLTKGFVNTINIDTADVEHRMQVGISGFNGDLNVKLNESDYGYQLPLYVDLQNSYVAKATLSGKQDCHISGTHSSVGNMGISDATAVSMTVDVEELVVDETNKEADIRIYSDVNNLVVKGEKNDIVLPSSATVNTALVEGDSIRVYGTGTVETAEVTGTGANVATMGTEVEGENDATIPNVMQEMIPPVTPRPTVPAATPIPLEGAAYVGSGEYLANNEWWAQYPISQEALLGGVAPEEVDHITFYGKNNIAVGYNPAGTADWKGIDDGTKKITVKGSDIEFFDSVNIIMRSNSGIKELVYWRVFTEPEVESDVPEAIHTFTYDEYSEIKAENENGAPAFSVKLLNYLPEGTTLAAGDTVKVAVTFSGDVAFTANVGAMVYDASNPDGKWQNMKQAGVEESGSVTIEVEYQVAHGNSWVDASAQIWYMGKTNTGITIDSVTVEKVGGDDGYNPDDNYTGDYEVTWTFNGDDDFLNLEEYKYGDVSISIDYYSISTASKYLIAIVEMVEGQPKLTVDDLVYSNYLLNEDGYFEVDAAPPVVTDDTFSSEGYLEFVLKEETAKRLCNGKNTALGVQVLGVVVDGLGVSPAEDNRCLSTDMNLNTSYPGDYSIGNTIPAGVFAQYDGPVTVKLNYEMVEDAEWGQVQFSANWTALDLAEYNNDGYYLVDTSKYSAVFELTEENVATIIEKGGLGFPGQNVIVTDVEIYGAGEADPDAFYAGDYGIAHKFFAAELEQYKDTGVTVELVCERKIEGEYDYWITLTHGNTDKTDYIRFEDSEDYDLTASLDAATIQAILADTENPWCGIKVNGVIVLDAYLTDGTGDSDNDTTELITEVAVNTGYQGNYAMGNTIPAAVFEQYDGAVTVELEYEMVEGSEWGQIQFNTSWTALELDEYNNDGYYLVDTSASTMTFELDEEDVAQIIEKGSVGFVGQNVIVTKATVTGEGEENPDALYAGEYAIAHKFFKAELEEYAETGLTVTVSYKKTTANIDWPWITLTHAYADKTDYIGSSAATGTLEATIDAATVAAILADTKDPWCGIKVNGLIIEDITVEAAEDTTTGDLPEVDPDDGGTTGTATGSAIVGSVSYGKGEDGKYTSQAYQFLIKDYLKDYATGETVKITVTMSSTDYFNGALGGNDLTAEKYISSDFESTDNKATVELTLVETYNGYGNIDLKFYWMNSETQVVDINSITVERVTE